MKLLFEKRLLSWFDSADIFNEAGDIIFCVKSVLSSTHQFDIFDAYNCHAATLRKRILSPLPKYKIVIQGKRCGNIRKDFNLTRPRFKLNHFAWVAEGNLTQWDYEIKTIRGTLVARVFKELRQSGDTYCMDVVHSRDALAALLMVLAIDVEKK